MAEADLVKMMAEIRESQLRFEARCPPCQEIVAAHSRVLDGDNGKGLRTRVSLVEQRLLNKTSETYWLRKHFGKMLTAVLAALGALIGYVVGGK